MSRSTSTKVMIVSMFSMLAVLMLGLSIASSALMLSSLGIGAIGVGARFARH